MPTASTPTSLPPISTATQQLIGYGLLFGGAIVVGKLMIDGLMADMDAAKARKKASADGAAATPPPEKIEPIGKPNEIHVKLSDVVRFMAMCASVYSLVAELPTLVSEWGAVEAQLKEIAK